MSSHKHFEDRVSLLTMSCAAPFVWMFYLVVVSAILYLVSLHSEKAVTLMMTILLYLGIAVTVANALYPIIIGKRRRYFRSALRPVRWYLMANVSMFGGFAWIALLFMWGKPEITGVPPEQLAEATLTLVGIGLFPLAVGFLMMVTISRSLTLEFHKVYEYTDLQNDEYRLSRLETISSEYLGSEDQLLSECRLRCSSLRLFLMLLFWNEIGVDRWKLKNRLLDYYREPILLLKMAKHKYKEFAQNDRRTSMVALHNRGEGGAIQVPNTFDLQQIERDLLKYRLDQHALTAYVEVLLLRFKSAQQRKSIDELFKYLDLVVTYNEKVYAARESKEKLNLLALDTEVKRKQYERQIAELDAEINAARHTELVSQPEQKSEDELFEERKKSMFKEIALSSEVQEMKERIKRKREERLRMEKLDEFTRMLDAQAVTKAKIDLRRDISPTQRKELMRQAEAMFINQVDDFGKGL